jgi:hypothetical protein
MRLSPWLCTLSAAAVTIAVACTSTESSTSDPGPSAGADAGGRRGAETSREGGTIELDPSDSADASDAPVAPTPTRKTTLESSMGGVVRTLVRAQFGSDRSDAGATIYLEAHLGGDPACPTETSPVPDYTLVVANIPRGAPGQKFTLEDGVAVTYFDFKGDQIRGDVPLRKAAAATVTIVEIDGDTSVEIEVDATFAEGTVKGRAYATYCESLSN